MKKQKKASKKAEKVYKMEAAVEIPKVTGTTATIRKMISHKVSKHTIFENLTADLVAKGVPESVATKRVRGLYYQVKELLDRK